MLVDHVPAAGQIAHADRAVVGPCRRRSGDRGAARAARGRVRLLHGARRRRARPSLGAAARGARRHAADPSGSASTRRALTLVDARRRADDHHRSGRSCGRARCRRSTATTPSSSSPARPPPSGRRAPRASSRRPRASSRRCREGGVPLDLLVGSAPTRGAVRGRARRRRSSSATEGARGGIAGGPPLRRRGAARPRRRHLRRGRLLRRGALLRARAGRRRARRGALAPGRAARGAGVITRGRGPYAGRRNHSDRLSEWFTSGAQWVKVGQWEMASMLLGEHEHTLDDKNRLTLPAKLREQLGRPRRRHARARRLPLRLRRPTLGRRCAERVGTLDPFSRRGARRCSGTSSRRAADAELDKQGRMVIPARLLERAGIGREVTVAGRRTTTSRSGIAPPGASSGKESKGARKMLPSVLPTETDHVPVLADEVLAALAPRPGRDGRSTARSARAAMPACSPRGCAATAS